MTCFDIHDHELECRRAELAVRPKAGTRLWNPLGYQVPTFDPFGDKRNISPRFDRKDTAYDQI